MFKRELIFFWDIPRASHEYPFISHKIYEPQPDFIFFKSILFPQRQVYNNKKFLMRIYSFTRKIGQANMLKLYSHCVKFLLRYIIYLWVMTRVWVPGRLMSRSPRKSRVSKSRDASCLKVSGPNLHSHVPGCLSWDIYEQCSYMLCYNKFHYERS